METIGSELASGRGGGNETVQGGTSHDAHGPCMVVVMQLQHGGPGELQVPSLGALQLQVHTCQNMK